MPNPSPSTEGQRPAGPLRLSVSMPGSASLGAYQAGAVSALAVVVEELRRDGRDVRVDGVGGVSAGAIVALFFAHSLLTGSDASALLRRAWVDDVSSSLLRSRSDRAPLDFSRLEPRLRELLGRDTGGDEQRRQRSPVGLHIGLTNLLGLTYRIQADGEPVEAMSFVDWGRFVLDPDDGPRQLTEPVGRSPLDFALASAAHPLAFAPRMLDRSGDVAGYTEQGITNLPDSDVLWYSDGGLVESEPVGRTIAAAHAVSPADEDGAQRLHLVIDPRSSGPSGSARWGNPDEFPSWVAGIRRAMSILPSQSLHEDLRHVATQNHRLAQIDALVDALQPCLVDEHGTGRRRLAQIVGDDDLARPEQPLEDVVRQVLEALCGVTGKERVGLHTISPLLVAREEGSKVPGLLAGDIVGAFGGFLSRRLRESDYVLGWDSTLAWTHHGLSHLGLGDDDAQRIRRSLEERRGASWKEVNAGNLGISRLDRRARLELARVALHVARIVTVELLPAAISGRLRRSSRTHDEDPASAPTVAGQEHGQGERQGGQGSNDDADEASRSAPGRAGRAT